LRMQPPGGWTLNGRSFQMTAVAPDERVRLGSTEIWEFVNEGGGRGGMMGGMSLPHPIHMHGEQFQILDRKISRAGHAAWESLSEGYVDEGWKDTVLVMPGERVRVIRRFEDFEQPEQTGEFEYLAHLWGESGQSQPDSVPVTPFQQRHQCPQTDAVHEFRVAEIQYLLICYCIVLR